MNFGQLLGASIDRLVKDRVSKHVKSHSKKKKKRVGIVVISCVLLVVIGLMIFFLQSRNNSLERIAELKIQAEEYAKPIEDKCNQNINWSPDISEEQLQAVKSILNNMEEVAGGTFMQGASSDISEDMICPELEVPLMQQTVELFYIGKYEVSTLEWCLIMGKKFEESDSLLPITNVTYEDCQLFVNKLADLTGLNFRMPTETEWEWAARGGIEADSTIFAGSNNVDDVAWYSKNSGGKPHICDASNSPMYPNGLNLYDMSGNVAEWCSSLCLPYNSAVAPPNQEAMVVRGGSFDAEPFELTVFHRDPKNTTEKDETVGLRLVIGN